MDKKRPTVFRRIGRYLWPGPRCSFCGKPAEAVERLVAGANAYICGECVVKCVGVLEEHGGLAPASPGR